MLSSVTGRKSADLYISVIINLNKYLSKLILFATMRFSFFNIKIIPTLYFSNDQVQFIEISLVIILHYIYIYTVYIRLLIKETYET